MNLDDEWLSFQNSINNNNSIKTIINNERKKHYLLNVVKFIFLHKQK